MSEKKDKAPNGMKEFQSVQDETVYLKTSEIIAAKTASDKITFVYLSTGATFKLKCQPQDL